MKHDSASDGDYDAFWSDAALDVGTPVHVAVRPLLYGPLVVDLGCGTAQLATTRPDLQFIGFDVSVDALTAAAGRGVAAVQADLRALPVPASAIEVVVCLDVLEHVADPLPLLAELRRVLSPEGVALVGVPNPRYLKHLLRLAVGGRMFVTSDATSIYRGGHLQDHTEADIRELCRSAGLRVDSVHAVHAHRAAVLTRRLLGDHLRAFVATGLLYLIARDDKPN